MNHPSRWLILVTVLLASACGSDRKLLQMEGHVGWISSVNYSPDGRNIITASWDRSVKIWDATTGKELLNFSHDTAVESAAYSPDGQFIVTTSGLSTCPPNCDNVARLWNITTGEETIQFPVNKYVVTDAVFSPDGQTVVTTSWDSQTCEENCNIAEIWDVATGAQLLQLIGHTSKVTSVDYSPDGQKIVTASADGTARVWDAANGALILQLAGHTRGIEDVEYSPDGRSILTVSWDKAAKVWDTTTGELLLQIEAPMNLASGDYSPNGQLIVTGGGSMQCGSAATCNNMAILWDSNTGKELLRLTTSDLGYVTDAKFSPDGDKVVITDEIAHIIVWNVSDLKGTS